jgi:Mrp family chromosome partitioning ATPase
MSLDLTLEMGKLAASLGPLASPAAPDRGRVIQFAAARGREGTSTVAREFARFIAARSRRPVWLVDADLMVGAQHANISANQMHFGQMGQAAAGTPDGSMFFRLSPPSLDDKGYAIPDARYLVAHPVGGPHLWVTRFRRERLTGDQTAQIVSGPAYWNALRKHADLIVVDAPAADRAQTSVMLAPAMDATVLVLAADAGQAHEPAILKGALQGAGGRIAGLFLNKVEIEPPAFLKAVMP